MNRSDPRTISIETTTHGRVLVQDPADDSPAGLLVACHGYGTDADEMLAEVVRVPGLDRWRVASVQGLHRFYTRQDRRVVASWMTRQDRDQAIVDNVAYVQRVVDAVRNDDEPLVFVGFSQGASMAYRAAVLGDTRAAGVIALGGDIPPELKAAAAPDRWPPVLIGAGSADSWFADKVVADIEFLESAGVSHDVVRYDGGHDWTDEFRQAAGEWIARLRQL